MSTQRASALLEAAMITLEGARAELNRTADPAPISALFRFVARFDAFDASDYTPAEQAAAYDETAGVLRRRAARMGTLDAETETRARYFEQRAVHKRAGDPLPHALRTANEHLGYVDALRRELVDLVDVIQLIGSDEIQSFVAALERPSGAIASMLPVDVVSATFESFVEQLGALAFVLGVSHDAQGTIDFASYRKVTAGPPAPPMDATEPPPPATSAAAAPTSNGAG